YFKSAAFHEAGHSVIAAVLRMPLREGGLRVDSKGSGLAQIWRRSPGDSHNLPADVKERECSIVMLYAGLVAQQLFFPGSPPSDAAHDELVTNQLLSEMFTKG